MLQMLIVLAMACFPLKPAALATEALIAGENQGIVIQAEDKAAMYRYVEFSISEGDCLNDWLTHMQPQLRPIAQDTMHGYELCSRG